MRIVSAMKEVSYAEIRILYLFSFVMIDLIRRSMSFFAFSPLLECNIKYFDAEGEMPSRFSSATAILWTRGEKAYSC